MTVQLNWLSLNHRFWNSKDKNTSALVHGGYANYQFSTHHLGLSSQNLLNPISGPFLSQYVTNISLRLDRSSLFCISTLSPVLFLTETYRSLSPWAQPAKLIFKQFLHFPLTSSASFQLFFLTPQQCPIFLWEFADCHKALLSNICCQMSLTAITFSS